jgi:hypothetical protein
MQESILPTPIMELPFINKNSVCLETPEGNRRHTWTGQPLKMADVDEEMSLGSPAKFEINSKFNESTPCFY